MAVELLVVPMMIPPGNWAPQHSPESVPTVALRSGPIVNSPGHRAAHQSTTRHADTMKRRTTKKVNGARERVHGAAGNGRDVKVIEGFGKLTPAALGARAESATRRERGKGEERCKKLHSEAFQSEPIIEIRRLDLHRNHVRTHLAA